MKFLCAGHSQSNFLSKFCRLSNAFAKVRDTPQGSSATLFLRRWGPGSVPFAEAVVTIPFHLLQFRALVGTQIKGISNFRVGRANEFLEILHRAGAYFLHGRYPLLQEWFQSLQLLRSQTEFRAKLVSKRITNALRCRRFPLLFPVFTQADDRAGHTARDKNRRQVKNDFPFGQVFHGYRLIRMAESAMATGPGSR